MAPEFAKAAKALQGRARFAKLDTEVFTEASVSYGIRGISLLVTFHEGREISRRAGATPAGGIIDWVGAVARA